MFAKYSQRVTFAVLVGLVAPLGFHQAAQAQTQATSASLTGVVHDASEAAIAGAKVTLVSPGTGVARAFNTDAQGRYSFNLLPPSTYTLTVEASGFAPQKQGGIALGAGQSASQ